MKNITKQQKGFTIIEVLIVLAIAGLIILIVFLAVPSLQRNSRNTRRKNDAARILSGVVEAGNNSNWPPGWGVYATVIDGLKNGGTLSIYNGALTYDGGDVIFGGVPASADANVDRITLVVNAKCNGETAVAAQPRSAAVLYRVETGGGSQPQCESS